VIALPPSFKGGVNVTDTDETPPVAVPIVGGSATDAALAGTAATANPVIASITSSTALTAVPAAGIGD
jgi:hypothetical protein